MFGRGHLLCETHSSQKPPTDRAVHDEIMRAFKSGDRGPCLLALTGGLAGPKKGEPSVILFGAEQPRRRAFHAFYEKKRDFKQCAVSN